MRAGIILLVLLFPLQSVAGDVTLTWTNPTGTEQCVAGPAYTNPGGTKLYQLVADIPDPTQSVTSYTLTGLKPGTYEYVSTSYDDTGVMSRVSGSATKDVTEFVTIAPNVYYIIAQPNFYAAVVVGTVPLGTVCNLEQTVNGKYAVDIDLVSWTGTSRPLAVVAECG